MQRAFEKDELNRDRAIDVSKPLPMRHFG